MKNKQFLITIIAFAVTLLATAYFSHRGIPTVVKTNLENIPTSIAGYSSTEDAFPQSVYDVLNADKNIYRHYKRKDGSDIDLYIGYYGTAKGGRTPHNPYACFPSAGWTILEAKPYTINFDNKIYKKRVTVNYMLVKRNDQYEVVMHWYQSEGVYVLDTGFKRNIQRFKNRILKNRNDGAFVRLSAATTKDNIKKTKALVGSFAKNILLLLPRYWPEEKVL